MEKTQFGRLGLIGVGRMGRPIAENLLQKEFPLTIFARNDHIKEEMKALGAVLRYRWRIWQKDRISSFLS